MNHTKVMVLFLCDPTINTKCNKDICSFEGRGPCERTSNYRYSKHYNSKQSAKYKFVKHNIGSDCCIFHEEVDDN